MDQYSVQVLNVAARILGDADKAQDVHQEVFLLDKKLVDLI